MKRKRSETIQICGETIVINYLPDMQDNDGEFLPEEREIRINMSANRSQDQLILHEILHAIFTYSGFAAQLDPTGKNHSLEEGLVSCLEQHLIKVINIKPRQKL